jgi:hypothetical protein
VPEGARPFGTALVANAAEGQSIEGPLSVQGVKCYTVVAAGAGSIGDLDSRWVQATAAVPTLTHATDDDSGNVAVVGKKPGCFRWAFPGSAQLSLVVTATRGQGPVAAQVYVK